MIKSEEDDFQSNIVMESSWSVAKKTMHGGELEGILECALKNARMPPGRLTVDRQLVSECVFHSNFPPSLRGRDSWLIILPVEREETKMRRITGGQV